MFIGILVFVGQVREYLLWFRLGWVTGAAATTFGLAGQNAVDVTSAVDGGNRNDYPEDNVFQH